MLFVAHCRIIRATEVSGGGVRLFPDSRNFFCPPALRFRHGLITRRSCPGIDFQEPGGEIYRE